MTTCAAVDNCNSGAAIGHVCITHHDRIARMLTDLETEAALLTAVPSMQQRIDSGKGSLASEQVPVRLDVLVHTDRRRGTGKSETDDDALAAGDTLPILDVLHSWARIVREERALDASGPATVTGERLLLTRHLDWCCQQPWIDEMYTDLRQLVGQLKAANGHRAQRPYSGCPTVGCAGAVWIRDELQAVWRRYTDRCAKTWEQAPGAAVCDTCAATWTTPAEKARLDRMVDDMRREAQRPRTEDGRPMLTARELVDGGHATSLNSVRVTVHRRRIVSVGGHYDPADFAVPVQESA